MTQAWQKRRFKAAKHARLIKQKPELRAALYGSTPAIDASARNIDARIEEQSRPRETAQLKEEGNGKR